MINFLFSSINRNIGFTKKQSEYLIKYLPNKVSIAFIPSMFDDFNKNDLQLEQYKTLFNDIRIDIEGSIIIDNRMTKKDISKIINKFDVIFLLGGNPEQQMKSILEYNLIDSIKSKSIIIGVSAGAMNQTKRVLYKDDFDNFSLKDYTGLGFIDFSIFPHYDANNTSFIKEVNDLKKINSLVLLPNESFIFVDNNKIEIVGNYYN